MTKQSSNHIDWKVFSGWSTKDNISHDLHVSSPVPFVYLKTYPLENLSNPYAPAFNHFKNLTPPFYVRTHVEWRTLHSPCDHPHSTHTLNHYLAQDECECQWRLDPNLHHKPHWPRHKNGLFQSISIFRKIFSNSSSIKFTPPVFFNVSTL